jgi:hypothetical protein
MEGTDFSFNMQGIDRHALLAEAAARLDALGGYLGGSDATTSETEEGRLLRELDGDTIGFPEFPTVYKITDENYLTSNLKVPVNFRTLTQDFNFYWLYIPVALFPKSAHRGFRKLEMIIEFNRGETIPHLRPRAYQILPNKKFQTLLEISNHVEVRLDENFELSATAMTTETHLGYVSAKTEAGLTVKQAAGLGMVLGPFSYHLTRTQIDHTPIGYEKVRWTLDGAEFFQQDAPELIVIVQIPIAVKQLKVEAAMQAYRYFSLLPSNLQRAIDDFPEWIQRFLRAGLPVPGEAVWDLTPRM